MAALRCPICAAELEGKLLECDILSAHLRNGDCTFAYAQDTLDLYHFFLTDALLLINTLLRLSSVKHVYLKLPNKQKNYYLTYLRTSQEVSELTTFEPSFFDNLLIKFGFQQSLGNILPFLQFKEDPVTLLQIPFETLKNDAKIAILYNGKVNIVDIAEISKKDGVFFSEAQIKLAFFRGFITAPLLPDEQASSSTAASTCNVRQRLDELEEAEQARPLSALAETINAIQKLLETDHLMSGDMRELLQDYLGQAIKRRAETIYCKYDIVALISALVPQIETIDGVRALPRKEAEARCVQMFSFPHKQMFPTRTVAVERGVVGSLLESVRIFSRITQNKTIFANQLNADLIRNAFVCPEVVDFALRSRTHQLLREVDMTEKALLLQAVAVPRCYSVSSARNNAALAPCNTGNFRESPEDFSLRSAGRLTSLAMRGNALLIGNEKGVIFELDPLLTAAEQGRVRKYSFEFPDVTKFNSINGITADENTIFFTTDTGFVCNGGKPFGLGAPIHFLDTGERKLIATNIGVFVGTKLLYPEAICAYSYGSTDYVGYSDGRIDFCEAGQPYYSTAVSSLPISRLVAKDDTLIVVDIAFQAFSYKISSRTCIGKLTETVLQLSTFSLGFLGHRVVLGRRGLIRICENDLKVFREVIIDDEIEMSQFCQVDSGSFAVIITSGPESEVVIIDLLRDSEM